MRIINQFNKNNQRAADFFKSVPQLYIMFKKQTRIELLKISFLAFSGKFINMIVMFMPLKVLFVLSGSKNIQFLQDIENSIGRDVYIAGMISIISILYFLNIVLQIYEVKLINRQESGIDKKEYKFRGQAKSFKVISKTYAPFCQVLASLFLILIISIILFVLNVQFAIFYLSVIFVYGVIMEQWAFQTHKTKLMKKLNIDSKQFIKITGILLYLILFMGIIVVVLNTDMVVIVAILMLILVRLGNGALKSFFSCQIKLRHHYL